MKLLPLILIALIGCHKPTPPVSAPASASEPDAVDGDLAELQAFAELVGLVRFFHPSDESASTPWDLFVIHGVQTLLDEPGFHPETVRALFAPIAPTLQLSPIAAPEPIELPKVGDRVVAWAHRSVGLHRSTEWGHQTFRQGRTHPATKNWARMHFYRNLKPSDPAVTRWRFALEISGDPGATTGIGITQKVDGVTQHSARQTVRAPGNDTRGRMVLEGTLGDPGTTLRLFLAPFALKAVTIHEARLEWGDASGDWTTVPLPFELGDKASAAWLQRGQGYTCTGEESTLTCLRDHFLPTDFRHEIDAQLGDTWQGSVGGDLFATLPLALPGDASHTYPRGHEAEAEAGWREQLAVYQGDDRSSPALRVATLIQAWTVMRHFHPHPESITEPWDVMLSQALAGAMSEPDRPLMDVLSELLVHIPDGHIDIFDAQGSSGYFCPLRLEEADGRVFVVASGLDELVPGDEIVQIRNESVRVLLDRLHARFPGTDQWRRAKAVDALRKATGGDLPMTRVREGKSESLTLRCTEWRPEPRPRSNYADLGDGRFYADLREAGVFTEERIEQLAGASGLIIDLRGYPKSSPLLDHLAPDGGEDWPDWAWYPIRTQPDTIQGWDGSGFRPSPAQPKLDLPIAWLTGPRAISYSESMLSWARHLDPDTRFIGATPSAGANGVNHATPIVGGFLVGWTSMRATMIDETPFFGVGIPMDESTPWTATAAVAGRDPAFEAAMDWLEGKHLPDSFLGNWKGDDGIRLLITRAGVNHFDGRRWTRRDPILEWTESGPLVCERGRPVSQSLSREGVQLRVRRGDRTVLLSPQSDPTAALDVLPRVFLEPPPAVAPERARSIAAELSTRAAANRTARTGAGGDPRAIGADNRRWLLDQLDAVGWIDPGRFGLQATEDAWLLVHHSDDLGLLMAVAPRLEGVAGLEESWAKAVDDIAARTGAPQRFGTQTQALSDGTLAVLPVTSPERVAAERAALELEPWPVYLGDFESGAEIPILDCTERPAHAVPTTPPPPE